MEVPVLSVQGLWVYAGLVKLHEYDIFKVQLGKSPMLADFAGIIAIVLPRMEIVLALSMFFRKLKTPGLYLSLFMLAAFTAYLVAITKFSYDTPCSCGGIIGDLSWNKHIVFNLTCIAVNIIGIFIAARQTRVVYVGDPIIA